MKCIRVGQKCQRTYGGITFDSIMEMERYMELLNLQRYGSIKELTLQPCWVLAPKCKLVPRGIKYKADFMYNKMGVVHVEEVKGYATPVYKLRRNMWLSLYGENYAFHEIFKEGTVDYNC